MSQADHALTAIILTITVIVFVLDLITPLGMAIWALYILPLGLTRWAVWEPLIFVVAGSVQGWLIENIGSGRKLHQAALEHLSLSGSRDVSLLP